MNKTHQIVSQFTLTNEQWCWMWCDLLHHTEYKIPNFVKYQWILSAYQTPGAVKLVCKVKQRRWGSDADP